MDFLLRHKLIFILVVFLVIGFFWYGSSSGSSSGSILSTNGADSGNPAEKDLVSTLLTLRAVSLSGTILSDPAFRGLQDFSTQIIPENIGRADPFAPLPSSIQPAPQTGPGTQSAQLFKTSRPK